MREKREKILIAGGDTRQIYCGNRLKKSGRFDVEVTGFDSVFVPEDMKFSGEKHYSGVILPVIAFDEDGFLNSPNYSGKLSAQDILPYLDGKAKIFAGKTDKAVTETFSGHTIYSYLYREEFSLKNAVPTAEGAVQIALEELPVTLSGMRVLIAGYGRIGTALATILKGFSADITAVVRSPISEAKAGLNGIKAVRVEDMGTDYGLVFNTAPEMIFTREILGKFPPETLFIDLASKPGGIDFSSASEMGRKVIWALGIPGKTSPVTAGEITAETVMQIISEEIERE